MGFFRWKPYVPVAQRRKKAEKAAAKARKAGTDLAPVTAYRGPVARTFWGKAWCDNLECYSDYANRLPRGRTYVRNGAVIDLKIMEGEVQALVMGSSLYRVSVSVAAVPRKHWQSVSADCAGSIDSLVELLQGQFSKAVMERICLPDTGLFPTPREIDFSCTCPDWASLCKHVAAVLYGVGARLDGQPELIFKLRRVDARDLVTRAGAGLPKSKQGPVSGKVLDEALLGDVFGLDMADDTPAANPATPRRKSKAAKVATTTAPKATAAGKTAAAKRTAGVRKSAKEQAPARSSARPRQATPRRVKAGGTTLASKAGAAQPGRGSGRLTKKGSR
ncbi:MAG: SWIM zinc finger family protein [Acidiferrobacterales bacterium]